MVSELEERHAHVKPCVSLGLAYHLDERQTSESFCAASIPLTDHMATMYDRYADIRFGTGPHNQMNTELLSITWHQYGCYPPPVASFIVT